MLSASSLANAAADPTAWIWTTAFAVGIGLVARRHARPGLVVLALWAAWSAACALDVPAEAIRRLERPYYGAMDAALALPPASGAQCVFMCGGILGPSPSDRHGVNLAESFDRLVAAAECASALRVPLVLGGGAYPDGTRESDVAARLLAGFHTGRLCVEQLPACYDTLQEADRMTRFARERGWTRVAVATSAYHMDRTRDAFAFHGFSVIPLACDFQATPSACWSPGWNPVPSVESLRVLKIAVRERCARAWYRFELGSPEDAGGRGPEGWAGTRDEGNSPRARRGQRDVRSLGCAPGATTPWMRPGSADTGSNAIGPAR